jgi:hypothetical protein
MDESLLRAGALAVGVVFYGLLIQYAQAKQAASRAKHGRGLIEQTCYRLGYLWARRNKTAQNRLNRR